MELLIGFLLSFVILLFGVFKGIYIGYSISISFIIFAIISYRMGHSKKDILINAWNGSKNSLVILGIFVLIGMVTASWLVAGTIPAIVYYAMKIMNPRFFVVFSFLVTSLVSYMLGTSLGTSSTIGVVLMIMARGGDINLNLVGGAILAGCYFGDRCSPMSSSANLISSLTNTELYPMLKKFRKTMVIPFLLSIFIYLLLSINNPLNTYENTLIMEIKKYYIIDIVVLLPAITMLVLSILQINVKKSMMISILIGIIVATFKQGSDIIFLIKTLLFGYKLDPLNPLATLLKGGGVFSMIKPSFAIFVSCAMTGVLEHMGLFEKAYGFFKDIESRKGLYLSTVILSFFSAAFGGNQSIAIIMVSRIMRNVYDRLEIDNYELATDISNTAILIAPIIPWNIANFVIANTLGLSPVFIVPYAIYLYITIIVNYIVY